jgi:hypothetical protein
MYMRPSSIQLQVTSNKFNQSLSGDWNGTKCPRCMQNQPNGKHRHPLAVKTHDSTGETEANREQTQVVATTTTGCSA